ncbi:helix-turn-helix domain-containing protein [Nakamurella sp.]|uniref:helix-turn-helix domain-containing protein n=1 Tax=Nakamurella sp. TaxID=1869182 RepID=UPI003B3B8019
MSADPPPEALVRLVPPPAARAAVPGMVGYRMPPLPGEHRGFPSPWLTLVFSLSGALPIAVPDGGRMRSAEFHVPVGGLHTRAVVMPRRLPHAPTADQRGIQLAVHPLAARAVFGLPAAALAGEVLEIDELVADGAELVADGPELAARLAGDRPGGLSGELSGGLSGAAATAVVARWLTARIGAADADPPTPELARAWQVIVGRHGRVRIGDVAQEVGWSRRHLTTRLRAEIGVGAKDLARLARFARSRELIGRRDRSLAQVAADAGYADQPHLTTEWREFAGCSPGRWIAQEFPFVQDGDAARSADSPA